MMLSQAAAAWLRVRIIVHAADRRRLCLQLKYAASLQQQDLTALK